MPEVEISIDEDIFLPCYRHLQDDSDIDIDFIYGSRDSGKSRDTAQRLILKCLQSDYFRYILARKNFNTIKDSQWQVLKDVVDDWGLSDYFKFTTHPLQIECVNGNRFLARGFDDPQQVKSIQNPSGAWVEEGNQLTKEDWITLITSIRSNKGRTKIDVTFNPEAEGDYRQFWLFTDYFAHRTEQSFTDEKIIKVGEEETRVKYRATHTTYNDNPYCSPQRKAVYEDLKNTSPYHYRMYAKGEWSNEENKSPFILTFNRDKHLGYTQYDPSQELYLSFDFNRNPMCCNVIQWDSGDKVRWIEVIKIPNSTIWTMCDLIKLKWPDALYIVCGDYSGNQQSGLVEAEDKNNYYKVIMSKLELADAQLQVVPNPIVMRNRVLINYCFQHLDILINPDTCQALITDIETAEVLADGKARKGERNDPTQQWDAIDGMRYFFNRYFHHLSPLEELEQ